MNQEAFAQLITRMDEDQLRKAIIAYGEKNEGFRQQFMTKHSGKEAPVRTAAGSIIMEVVRDIPVSANEHPIIDHSKKFKKVKQLMDKGRYSEVLDLAFANMDELAASRWGLADDEDEAIVEAIDEYFELLYDFISCDAGEELELRLEKHVLSQMENPAYDLNDHATHWINLASVIVVGDEEEIELLDKLGKMETLARSDGNWEAVQSIESARRLVEDPMEDLSDNGEDDEEDFDEDMINEQIVAAEARNDQPEVIRLLLEDLERSKKKDLPARYELRGIQLITILKANSSLVLNMRKLAQKLYEETGNPFFYEAMKDSYVKSEWEPLGKAWVARLESNLPSYIKGEADPSPLIDLYQIEYPDGDKLFKLLEQLNNLRLLNKYEDWFDEEYYSKLSRLYARLIKDYASRGSSPAANRLIYSSLLRLRDLDEGGITKKVLAALNSSYPDKDILYMVEERLDMDL